jgi:hypothetical protein
MKYIITCILVYLSFTAVSQSKDAKTRDTLFLYFPLKNALEDSTEQANSLDTFRNVWYSKNLAAMKEPILTNCEEDIDIYRFTWLRTFHNPISIRVQKANNAFILNVKVLRGAKDSNSRRIITSKAFAITPQDWNQIQTKLKQINFWKLPGDDIDFRGFDGAEWILEGSTKDDYHFTTRWSPGKAGDFAKCCLYFLKLSRIKIADNEIY